MYMHCTCVCYNYTNTCMQWNLHTIGNGDHDYRGCPHFRGEFV